MKTVRLTMAQALVRYLTAQKIVIDRKVAPLFPGVFAIFGHGNVTCLGEALEPVRDVMPTWRGQNEQSMALAAIGYNKAMKRRQIMIALASIGPGSTNMITAAAVAMANRLPILILGGDVSAVVATALPEAGVDMYLGIGGAPGEKAAGRAFGETYADLGQIGLFQRLRGGGQHAADLDEQPVVAGGVHHRQCILGQFRGQRLDRTHQRVVSVRRRLT